MSRVVDEIKSVIKNEYITELCGYQIDTYLNFNIDVYSIDKDKSIEQSFKEYILENDYWDELDKQKNYNNIKEELKKYELEEIKYWVNDLLSMFHFTPGIPDMKRYAKIHKLEEILVKNKVKVYQLVRPYELDGRAHTYLYLTGEILGEIRCFETEKERFIISCTACD